MVVLTLFGNRNSFKKTYHKEKSRAWKKDVSKLDNWEYDEKEDNWTCAAEYMVISIVVYAALDIGKTIMVFSSLSYLGLGEVKKYEHIFVLFPSLHPLKDPLYPSVPPSAYPFQGCKIVSSGMKQKGIPNTHSVL
ncbi:hypothetical protein [Paenibacillus uliginis]|uniref:hypothetical protein n=1 Tax=Paenibacillus uliginis TaxID=683737 RepID=UPI001AD830A9|nr:hypothetical protein [Paenibacillus uliginis]